MKAPDHRKSRAPVGVDSKKVIGMRLMPSERAELIALAGREQRSIGSMARIVYLAGLKTMAREASNTRREN